MKKRIALIAILTLFPTFAMSAQVTLKEAVDATMDGTAGDSTGEDWRLSSFSNFTNQNLMNTEVYAATVRAAEKWTTGTAYTSGKLVFSGYKLYTCNANHLAASTTEPGVGADWAGAWILTGDYLTAANLVQTVRTTAASGSITAAPSEAAVGDALAGKQATLTNPIVAAGAQSITGKKTVDNAMLAIKGTSTGSTTFETANTSATNYTQTFPAATGTIALTSDITGATAINDLTDVDTTGKATGKVLKFDASGNLVVGDDNEGEGGSDAAAIHDNVSAEISAITEKASPVSADLLLIEDSAASNAKKRVQVGNLPYLGTSAKAADADTLDSHDTAYFQTALTNPIVAAGAQSITGAKTFDKDMLKVKGTSTGSTNITTANTSATSYTATLPAKDGTVAMTSDITGTNSGTNTGDVTISTANGLSLSSQALSLAAATTSTPGAMTAAQATELSRVGTAVATGTDGTRGLKATENTIDYSAEEAGYFVYTSKSGVPHYYGGATDYTLLVSGGALGTPSGGTLTNATGLPIAGVTGWGTGIATALAINTGSAGAPVLFNGAGGTPSSLNLTNALVNSGTSLPGTCTAGALFLDTDADTNGQLYSCVATNTWKDVDDDGGAGGMATTDIDTSSELIAILGDESGTGALIFAGGNIAAATAITASAQDNDTSVATTAFVNTEIAADAVLKSAVKSLDFDWKSPVDVDDRMIRIPAAITVTGLYCIATGSTPSIAVALNECDNAGANCAASGATATANGGVDSDTTITDGAYDAADYMQITVGAPTGTVGYLTCSVTYTN